jgi:hypothetical protein
MVRRVTVDSLSPARQRLIGSACTGVGVVTVWLVTTHPERLRAPAWVAYAACACFVIAGVAIALHSWLSRRAYAWMMVSLLAVMTVIPAWIALGAGSRQCRATTAMLSAETGCRIGFGVSAVVLAVMLVVAVASARRTDSAPR